MIGNSYCENYEKEYRSTNVDELLEYMDENFGDNDIVIYNYQLFDFIYALYFDTDDLVFLDNFDFSAEYDNIWFLDSCGTPWLSNDILVANGLSKEYIGHYSIEHNEFQLWRIFK